MAEHRIHTEALRTERYAPFGDVIVAHRDGAAGTPANQGTARRFDRLAALENLRPGSATLNLSVFRCAPHAAPPFAIDLLERHASSTQVFVPIRAARYLVVVALGGDRPDVATLRAFVASNDQGISYRPGVWHHPMIALDSESDFTCLVFEDGSPGDCDVRRFEPDARPVIVTD